MKFEKKEILFIGIVIGTVLGLFLISLIEQTSVDPIDYSDAVETCNENLILYINQTPDWSSCETQDECDLKQLKYSILLQGVFNCMNQSWEDQK